MDIAKDMEALVKDIFKKNDERNEAYMRDTLILIRNFITSSIREGHTDRIVLDGVKEILNKIINK